MLIHERKLIIDIIIHFAIFDSNQWCTSNDIAGHYNHNHNNNNHHLNTNNQQNKPNNKIHTIKEEDEADMKSEQN